MLSKTISNTSNDGSLSHLIDLPLPNISLPSTTHITKHKKLDLYQLPGTTLLIVNPTDAQLLTLKENHAQYAEEKTIVYAIHQDPEIRRKLELPFDILNDSKRVLLNELGLVSKSGTIKNALLTTKDGIVTDVVYPLSDNLS